MLSLFALLMGCNPQDAELTDAHWFTWIAANSSSIVRDELFDFLDQDPAEHAEGTPNMHIFECSGRGWNKYINEWEDGYIGTTDGSEASYITGGSCVCGEDDTPSCFAMSYEDCPVLEECAMITGDPTDMNSTGTEYYTFLKNDGYYLLDQGVEPWRTEALINGEGDLQLTVHHALPGNQDFRFHFTINPDFQPVHCVTDSDGNAKVEYVDGSDWVSRWSEDEEGSKIYYLNAGAYQINPSDSEDYWYLDNDWNSGFGMALFAGEEFYSIPTAYGNYENDPTADFMYADDRNNINMDAYEAELSDLDEKSEIWAEELHTLARASIDGVPAFEHKIEDNLWRPVNVTKSGLDGWAELNSSWVRIANDSDISRGGSVSGDFQIVYTALESNSRMLVKGSFSIPNLREDPWAYTILETEKRDEYETPYCEGATLNEAE